MTTKAAVTHTPGPWRVYQEKPNYYSVGTDYAHDRGHDQNIVRDVRKESNARLMAASPQLLEALELVTKLLELHVGNLYEPENFALAKAKAAIRSAKGETR